MFFTSSHYISQNNIPRHQHKYSLTSSYHVINTNTASRCKPGTHGKPDTGCSWQRNFPPLLVPVLVQRTVTSISRAGKAHLMYRYQHRLSCHISVDSRDTMRLAIASIQALPHCPLNTSAPSLPVPVSTHTRPHCPSCV